MRMCIVLRVVGALFELLAAIGRVELGSGGHFSRRLGA